MVKVLKGEKSLLFARKHADAATKGMQLVPYQTGLTFDPSRDSDSTATKSGSVNTTSSVETDLEVNFLNNTKIIFYIKIFMISIQSHSHPAVFYIVFYRIFHKIIESQRQLYLIHLGAHLADTFQNQFNISLFRNGTDPF